MSEHRQYEQTDARRETLVKAFECVGFFGFIILMIIAWSLVPA